jgi:FlaA1/EpsC-like NDP-sugar epimerase
VGVGRRERFSARHVVLVRVSSLVIDMGRAFQGALDSLGWVCALTLAVLFRYDASVPGVGWVGLAAVVPVAITLQVAVGVSAGLYRGRWRFGSFDEVAALAKTITVVTGAIFVLNLTVFGRVAPGSVPLGAGVGALTLCAGVRYTRRLLAESRLRPTSASATRLLVFGAGDGGDGIITSMLRTPSSPYVPVALLDDDPTKRHLRIRGVPVVGSRHDITGAAREYTADALLIAIPTAPATVIREVSEIAAEADLDVKVLPPLSELIGDPVAVRNIRPVRESDLLGRHPVDIDVGSIAQYITGRRVLVTGAGGSIGAELCRQVRRYAPAELALLDRDESALHAVQLSIEGKALLDTDRLVVADIRDRARLLEVFSRHQPEVIFHAAALKHLPLLEFHPEEAVKTNIYGSQNVLDAACQVGAARLVNVSTDKASDPISVLGYTKRIAERLTAFAAQRCGRPYLSTRFGNVLGSRGSVIDTFRAQIAAGGPVTLTDPHATRYFMTVEEAVRLVIQAGAFGSSGEALALDMGQPVRIEDIARRLIEVNADRPVGIVYTGLRPGEKLHEARLGADEQDVRPAHPLISHVPVMPLDPLELECLSSCDGHLVGVLAKLCGVEQRIAEPEVGR